MKNKKKYIAITVLLMALTGIISFQITYNTMRGKQSIKTDYSQIAQFVNVIDNNVRDYLPDSVTEEELEAGVAKGYLNGAGDEYGRYIPPEEYKEYKELSGENEDPSFSPVDVFLLSDRVDNASGADKTEIYKFKTVTKSAADTFKESIKTASGRGIEKIILDFSACSGGDQNGFTALADLLFKKNTVTGYAVTVKTGEKQELRTGDDATECALPLKVIISGQTYGFAELIAADLREISSAEIYGEQSAGRMSVQTLLTMPDGGAIAFTTADYLSSKSEKITSAGVGPDVPVPSANENGETPDDAYLAAAGYIIID